jgi:hypothetical protein
VAILMDGSRAQFVAIKQIKHISNVTYLLYIETL